MENTDVLGSHPRKFSRIGHGLGKVILGVMDAALLALFHGTSFRNYWLKGESQYKVYLKSPRSASVAKTHFG